MIGFENRAIKILRCKITAGQEVGQYRNLGNLQSQIPHYNTLK